MTTPRESRRLLVDVSKLSNRLFMCHANKEDLVGTGSLRYIEWGEAHQFHKRSSTKSRRRWYDLGYYPWAKLALNYMIHDVARTYYFDNACLVPNVFHTVDYQQSNPLQICSSLNSTFAQLTINLSGRANLGGGALKLELFELAGLRVVDPQLIAKQDLGTLLSVDWSLSDASPARLKIDENVFDALGLTQGERDDVYEGASAIVERRLSKAGRG